MIAEEHTFWKKEAIRDLNRYGTLEDAISNLKDKISMLNDSVTGGAMNYAKTPVSGGGTSQEDKLNNYIVKKAKYENLLNVHEKDYEITTNVLKRLPKKDREILYKAYIRRSPDHIQWIMDNYYVSKAEAYNLKNAALSAFTQIMYGIRE